MGGNVTLMDKSSVKKSIVGRGCTIGKSSKVVNSILMERVSIGDQFSLLLILFCFSDLSAFFFLILLILGCCLLSM